MVAETLTLPWVPVPLSWMGEGSAVQRLSEVVRATVAGYAAGVVGRNMTFAGLETLPLGPRFAMLVGDSE